MHNKKVSFFDLDLFKKLMVFVKPYKLNYYLVLIYAIFLSIFSILTPYLLKVIVDDHITKKDYDGMVFFIFIMLLTLLLEVSFQFLFVFNANLLGQNVIKDIRDNLFKKIINFKLGYFDNVAIGRLVTRVVNDIETIASIFSQGLFMIIADLLKMFLVIVVMLIINWKLSFIVFAILPIIVYATRLFQKSMKIAFEEVRKEVANLNSFVQERISGIKIVQIFNRELLDHDLFRKINLKHKNAWLKTVWFNSIFFPVAEISSSITVGLLVWYGGLNVSSGEGVTLGVIFLFIQMSQMLFRPLRQIADKFNTLQMGMVSTSRIFKILETESAIIDNGLLSPRSVKGKIIFKNVNFSYIPDQQVIFDLNLNIPAGQTIAIVGPTGAGKSSIINLISRFYEFDDGNITIDDMDIRNIKINSLRNFISVVPQDVFLFAASIYENVTLFDSSISKGQVIKAAKEIGVHDFILKLPNDYDYNIRERGVMLSSGQRQLIAFLRVFIINPNILILDEATSSIDSYSESIIQKAISKITLGKTSIIIAHRLETIRMANKIIYLENGRALEEGNHDQLMKNKNGKYVKLYDTQFNTKK
ncbi:MAG: antibiotic ABC transporter ATP-binding protein [Flavobacteriaceae bacterium]|nr:antibiotic ABC transporter ATP-binding protein [Flavobacteriaceae bacterium]